MISSNNLRTLILYLICIVFLSAHVYFVVMDYLKYDTNQSVTSELEFPMELPDVTICNNMIDDPETNKPKYEWTREDELFVIRKQSYQTTTKSMNEWKESPVSECEYTDFNVPCQKEYHKNYFYGICETISVGKTELANTPITGLTFRGTIRNIYKKEPTFKRHQVLLMVMHKPGTEPIFLRENIISVDLYSDTTISLRKKTTKLQVNCLEKEQMKGNLGLNFVNRTQYSYQVE